ncbi:hypothetical protein BMF94_3206 [Rhodotorula taiwanensis]|uniref:Uncharacterized protein n=1 Tax=Rhodotorula taiwanensis TaxID=741276 RepID=A0A2S5BAB8_9BASI|nr:hypothetical protein BMF94_3206 [Rhodotorula taiwanensis]
MTQPPTSFEQAVERISTLEAQLELARTLLQARCGVDLADELEKAGLGERRNGTVSSSTPSSGTAAPCPASDTVGESSRVDDVGSPAEAKPAEAKPEFDLGPLILRALSLRKEVYTGKLSEQDGVDEVAAMVQEHSLSEEQAQTLRAWAGQ